MIIKTYLFTAIRSLWKYKGFTLLNMLGLSIGICAALVIYLLVSYDFSFEKSTPAHERIYRIVSNFTSADDKFYNSGINVPLANAIPRELNGVETAAVYRQLEDMLKVTVPKENSQRNDFRNQEGFIYTTPSWFSILPAQWISGNAATSLTAPNQVVLNTVSATRYFPGIPADQITGRQLIFDDTLTLTVSGVVEAPLHNTVYNFIGYISYSTIEQVAMHPEDWLYWDNTSDNTQVLVKLPAGTDPVKIGQQTTNLFRKYFPKDAKGSDDQFYTLQPLADIHFDARFGAFGQRIAHKPTLYGLLVVAVFLLLLGCINFINLTTAQSSTRAKEIGIRKTMGSSKQQLIGQFMGETLILTLLATILACLLAPLLLKLFSDFIPAGIRFPGTGNAAIWPFIALLVIVVSFLAGIYPALVLSGFKPVQVLKNYSTTGNANTRKVMLRKTLTVSQFVVAQVFIIATLLVSQQVKYSLNKDIGMRKDAIVFVRTSTTGQVQQNRELLLQKIRAIPGIAMASLAHNPPFSKSYWTSTLSFRDGQKDIESTIDIKLGDTSYIHLYQLQLLAGRNIRISDSMTELLMNEAYARMIGFQNPAEIVGRFLHWDNKPVLIAGIVKDFNQKTLHEAIRPLVIGNDARTFHTIHILLQPQNQEGTAWKSTLSQVEAAYKSVYPDLDYKPNFFDESLARAYDTEQKTSKLLQWASGLALAISCLGLLGLVTFTTMQRTKEIGVRKVLGASVTQIIAMLSKDIITLVAIALLIATPIAWLGLHQWLQQFAYRTGIGWWMFVVTGAMMMLIALFTLGFQTIRAALANPVKSLRSE